MTNVELIDRLTHIFFDLVLPALVLWIGWQIRKWLPAEVSAHQEVSKLAASVHAPQVSKPPEPEQRKK